MKLTVNEFAGSDAGSRGLWLDSPHPRAFIDQLARHDAAPRGWNPTGLHYARKAVSFYFSTSAALRASLEMSMQVYQVVYDHRLKTRRIKTITVTGETVTGFSQPGPIALQPSKKNTFRRRRAARAYLATLERHEIPRS